MRQWTLLTVLSMAAILVAGWMLLVKPQHAKASQLNAQATSAQQLNSVLSNQLAALRAASRNMPAQQARLAGIAAKIPSDPELPTLVRTLTSAAQGAGVDLVSIAPSAPTAVTSTSPTAPASGRPTTAAPPLSQIQLSLSVKGTYFTIEQFFANLEGLTRALRVTGFTLTGSPASAATSGSTTGNAGADITASITAYVYLAPSAITGNK